MSNVRLPRAPAFIPPPPPPPSVETQRNATITANRESWGQTQDFVARGVGSPGIPPEQLLYKTQVAWRGVDVYLQPIPGPAGFPQRGTLSIFIYAILDGLRVLVASGRYACPTGAAPNLPARWIAGARSIASLYEVTAQWTQSAAAPVGSGQFAVSVEASNEAVALPDDLGAEIAAQVYLQTGNGVATGIGVNIAGVQIPNHLELVSVRASNAAAAAARFLQLFDTTLAIPANGTVPIKEWPLGAVNGAGIGETRVHYRAVNRPQLVASSTSGTLTVQTDCSISAEVR